MGDSKRKLFVTLDTEMDADIHWRKANPPEFTSIYEGIPDILRPIWNRQQVNPIYFVSPEVVKDSKCCEVLKEEIRQGAIVGAHLHPEYIEPCVESSDKSGEAQFPCFAYEKEIEKEKLSNLKQLIETNLGVTPVWYRAARYGADADTFAILQELGFQKDSSITPGIDWSSKNGPDHSKYDVHSFKIMESVHEYPITIMGRRFGVLGKLLPENWMFYRWLRPSHMFLWEQKQIIREADRQQVKDLVLMFHSMEVMVRKTPFVRYKWMQRYYLYRLEKTLEYAKRKGYQ